MAMMTRYPSDDTIIIDSLVSELGRLPVSEVSGRIVGILGLIVECAGLQGLVGIGDRCMIATPFGREIAGEVVGFRDDRALVMPFDALDGVALGGPVKVTGHEASVYPDMSWLGRVVGAGGDAIDGLGPLRRGGTPYKLRSRPPIATARRRVGERLDLGVRALNSFATCCRGQRMGIFAASGVGKSMLLSMLARYTSADVCVIGLIGERGREVQEFIEDNLGVDGLKRSVIVVATSDESALMRRQATYLTMTCAEFFRDRGLDVLCLMDSVTRFAMSLREIGLATGEPPTTKGYTPSVFSELPKLLERAGPGVGEGTITGLFTVLVDGDDHDEPIADAVRGILDGHIVMERSIAERGRYPSINVLRSISRTMPRCHSREENDLIGRARKLMATYADMEEMIRLGAYRKGSDQGIDESIGFHDALEEYLNQGVHEKSTLEAGFAELRRILSSDIE